MVVFVIGQSIWLGKHIQAEEQTPSGPDTPAGKP